MRCLELCPHQVVVRRWRRDHPTRERRHRGADDEGEMVSEVAVVLRDEAAVLEAGVQLHCEVLGEDERLGGKVKSGG